MESFHENHAKPSDRKSTPGHAKARSPLYAASVLTL